MDGVVTVYGIVQLLAAALMLLGLLWAGVGIVGGRRPWRRAGMLVAKAGVVLLFATMLVVVLASIIVPILNGEPI
jgi:hypothetical protein